MCVMYLLCICGVFIVWRMYVYYMVYYIAHGFMVCLWCIYGVFAFMVYLLRIYGFASGVFMRVVLMVHL